MSQAKELDAPTRFFRQSSHPFAEMYRKRVEQNRDLVVLVTDSSNDRGTGKTTETLRLAHGMDRTEEGLTTEKVAMDPRPLIKAYTEQPHMSGLALDESEVGLDKYKSGSAVNRAIRELVSTGRIEQKYLVLNAPADHLVDKDLKTLVDVWILVERRGFANVYRMDWSPHQGKQLTPHLGTIEWDPIPPDHQLKEVYDYLTDKKKGRLRGEDGDDFIKRSEAREMVEEAREEAVQEHRDTVIGRLAELQVKESQTELNQSQIGEVVDLSRSRVSQILANGD